MNKNEKETVLNSRRKGVCFLIIVMLLGVLFIAGLIPVQYNVAPVYAEKKSSVDASVTVVSGSQESYGAGVVLSFLILHDKWALGPPNDQGALFLIKNSLIVIKLNDTINECNNISIWAAKMGQKSPHFVVLASNNGRTWINVGSSACDSFHFHQKYSFSGTFGAVRYIAVVCDSTKPASLMSLDAVYAKGGGSSQSKKQQPDHR